MSVIVGFFRFWYDFIVGDDWRIAAGVAAVLVIGGLLVASGVHGEVLALAIGGALVVMFALPIAWLGTRPSE